MKARFIVGYPGQNEILHAMESGEVVIAFERKVQIWKNDLAAKVDAGELQKKPAVECTPIIPAYDTGQLRETTTKP